MGRAVMMDKTDEYWGVTIEFSSRYRKPTPLDSKVRVIARITKNSSRIFEGTGEIILEDGSVAVEGKGRYIKLALSKIADFDVLEQEWKVIDSSDDPDYFRF